MSRWRPDLMSGSQVSTLTWQREREGRIQNWLEVLINKRDEYARRKDTTLLFGIHILQGYLNLSISDAAYFAYPIGSDDRFVIGNIGESSVRRKLRTLPQSTGSIALGRHIYCPPISKPGEPLKFFLDVVHPEEQNAHRGEGVYVALSPENFTDKSLVVTTPDRLPAEPLDPRPER